MLPVEKKEMGEEGYHSSHTYTSRPLADQTTTQPLIGISGEKLRHNVSQLLSRGDPDELDERAGVRLLDKVVSEVDMLGAGCDNVVLRKELCGSIVSVYDRILGRNAQLRKKGTQR
ncbi:MAG: hypothetical protein GY718_17770 [Lentisphaerae bacterium]|nr:hypothetical protein [Lentisphaerota bacterium]